MILVTGGAGFIGSNLHAALAGRGLETVVVDRLRANGKWRNLAKHPPARIVRPDALDDFLAASPPLELIFHLGAVSETTASDGDRVWETNVELPLRLWQWCATHGARLIYASSAATYGDGALGFDDDPALLPRLRPLNLYGWTKHAFDLRVHRMAARGGQHPAQWVGLKFFNVYGPNEYHKGPMISVAKAKHDEVAAGEAAEPVPLRPARHRGRRSRCATSSGSAMWSMCCSGCWTTPASAASTTSAPERPAATSTWPMRFATRWAPRGGWRSCRCRSGWPGNTRASPRRGWTGCARRTTRAVHRARGRGATLREELSASCRSVSMIPVLLFPQFDPVAVQVGPIAIRWYALAYITGLVLGWQLMRRLARQGPAVATGEQVDDFLTWATLGVVLGGRLGYVLFYQPALYFAHPAQILAVWQGGMSFHGGVLGVVVASAVLHATPPHPAARLCRPDGGLRADRAGARAPRQLHQRRAVGAAGAGRGCRGR